MSLFSKNIDALADVIAFICNRSLEHCTFPARLAVANIICLYKKGEVERIENYRAISLLTAFSKVLEKMVSTRLMSYFLQNNLIMAAQFGFLPGRSTEEAVTHIVDSLYSSFDAGAHGVGVFIDLAKAFDSLDRSILCAKLKQYGVTGNALACFESYLSRQEQRVRFSGELCGRHAPRKQPRQPFLSQ